MPQINALTDKAVDEAEVPTTTHDIPYPHIPYPQEHDENTIEGQVGRQQKGFFSRQRLELLSKGLCASNATGIPKIKFTLSS
jgi:hypothetical protein